jgi:NTP pyrophosphatase (non-canonical NTP hydrolase)
MLNKDEIHKLYEDCIDFWGFEKQARVCQEECAELIVAISHILRKRDCAVEEVVEELADVCLIVGQMVNYFGPERVMSAFEFKVDKLVERLEKYKKGGKDGN